MTAVKLPNIMSGSIMFENILQGIIQKKSVSGSWTLPFVTFDKKCLFCHE